MSRAWKILIVDDEIHNLGVIKHVMEFHGSTTYTCETGEACLAFLEQQLPDFVLLDIRMPGLSGFDVVRAIRQNPKTNHLLVIALTASVMPGDYEQAIDAGFDGYIPKPIDVARIMDQINLLVEDRLSHD